MFEIGNITEVSEDKSLAKVTFSSGLVTHLLPILQMVSTFKKQYIPLSVGDQVAVAHDVDNMPLFIQAGIFSVENKEPSGAGKDKEITEYFDGTIIIYDSKSKSISISTPHNIIVNSKSVTLGEESAEPFVLGNKITKLLKDIKAFINSHQHIGNMGAPTPIIKPFSKDVNVLSSHNRGN